ncbi:MAG: DUF2298 domain-containing protein [Ktedonobacteraceae bacterium]
MLKLLEMWALIEVLGVVFLPLTVTIFHNLPDRGWAFSKAIGLAVLAFCVWFPLMVIHILPFSQLFILVVLLILAFCNVLGFLRTRQTIVEFVRSQRFYIVATELVFLGMVLLLGWLRTYDPAIHSYEMFMDEGFLSAIMRSPHFPPNDMWYAGFPINYYYYAQYTIAMLAKLIYQSSSVAFNTGISMFFGLTAINLFGVACNIVAWAQQRRGQNAIKSEEHIVSMPLPALWRTIPYGLLTMLMGLILGNLEATQLWWQNHGDLPALAWFFSSKVLPDTVSEFPAFSFLLSCFHAHVLSMSTTILCVALALNLFFSQGLGFRAFGRGWRMPLTLVVTAMVIGSLYPTNSWDYPTYLLLALVGLVLQQWLAHDKKLSAKLVLNLSTAGFALTALSFCLFLPFYASFSSPAQSLGLRDSVSRSSLRDELLIYGFFAFIFISLLLVSFLRSKQQSSLKEGRNVHMQWLDLRLLGLLATLLVGIIVHLLVGRSYTLVAALGLVGFGSTLILYHLKNRSLVFTILLGATAFALVAFCEVIVLKDPRGDSRNTFFKFYFQAWGLLSIACGAGVYFILESFRSAPKARQSTIGALSAAHLLWSMGCLVLLLMAAVYPLLAPAQRFNNFTKHSLSLDGMNYMSTFAPDDYLAIQWLNTHVQGDPGIIEAVGTDFNRYSFSVTTVDNFYGRVAAFTGMPTPYNWIGTDHEQLWRGSWITSSTANMNDFYRRPDDVRTIYKSSSPQTVLNLMARYGARYLYIGSLEQTTYQGIDVQHFSSFMRMVYQHGTTTIYEVP